MGYNKSKFIKSNDKKILHKVKKHWVVLSLATLMAIGGQAAATHVSAHADTTNDNNQTSNTQSLKERINSNLVKQSNVHKQNNGSNQQSQPVSAQRNQGITNAANNLHQRIVANAVAQQPKEQAQSVRESAPENQFGDDDSSPYNHNQDTSDTDSTMIINYIDTSNHNTIHSSKVDDDTADEPYKVNLHDLPQGYVLDHSQDNNIGWSDAHHNKYNGADQDSKYPTVYQGGVNQLYVYIKPRPQIGTGTIRIDPVLSNGEEVGSPIIQQNQAGTKYTYAQLQQYLQTAPTGYDVVNAGVYTSPTVNSDAGDVNPKGSDGNGNWIFGNDNSHKFHSDNTGLQDIKIVVAPISNPNANKVQGQVIYEDATNDNSFVSASPFNETKGSDINDNNVFADNFEDYVPNGYKFDANAGPNGDGTDADSTWQENGHYVIFVQPDGTNPNTPTVKKNTSFINVQYKDVGSSDPNNGQIVNTIHLNDNDSSAFNLNSYKGTDFENLIPDNYVKANPFVEEPTVSSFPSKQGQVSNVVMDVKLKPQANKNNSHYDPSADKRYSKLEIDYRNFNTNSDLSDADPAVKPVIIPNVQNGTTIDYTPYIHNFPSGYEFKGFGNHNDKVTRDETGNNANVIYLAPIHTNAQSITVNYLDQNGNPINGATHKISSDKLHLNQPVNLTTSDGSAMKPNNSNSTVPAGYHVLNGENVDAIATNNQQSLNVLVTGDQINHPMTYHFKRYVNGSKKDYNHHQISDYTVKIANPVVGQAIRLSADQLKPIGYNAEPHQSDVIATIKPDAANDSNWSTDFNNSDNPEFTTTLTNGSTSNVPNSYSYDYDNSEDNPDKNVKPINVDFVNQKGNKVSTATLNNGSDGQVVNDITKYNSANSSDNGPSLIPNGYDLNTGINQQLNWTFGTNPQTATVYVLGKEVSDLPNEGTKNNLTVHQNMHSIYSGNTSDTKTFPIKGRVGSDITVAPNMNDNNGKSIVPSDYDPSAIDHSSNVTIKSDGTLSNNNFNYDYNKQSGTIKVEYVQEGNPTPLKTVTVPGEYGSNFDQTLYTGPLNKNSHSSYMPNGYVLDSRTQSGNESTAPAQFTKSNNGSIFKVNVQQSTAMNVVYYDVTGGKHARLSGDSDSVEGVNGDKFPLQKYANYVPSGYEYVSVEGMPDFNPSEAGTNTLSFGDKSEVDIDIKKTPAPAPTNLGFIKVHYINSKNTNDQDLTDQVGEDDLASDAGHSFNGNTYLSAPYVPTGYDIYNDGSANSISNFGTGTKDLYVYVQRNNQPIPAYITNYIQYIDYNSGQPINVPGAGNPIQITGKAGSQIPYSQYENDLPSGYTFSGIKNGESTFTNNGEYDKIYVSKPAPSYGHVNVQFYSDNGGDSKTLLNSDTVNDTGKNGQIFDMSAAENDVPSDYTFESVEGNPIDSYNGGTQTLKIDVTKNKPVNPYSTVNVKYVDKKSGNSVTQAETGKAGSVFDVGPYQHATPANTTFDSMGSSVPPFYPASGAAAPTVVMYVDKN